jgi:excisionase family DNA binding protein
MEPRALFFTVTQAAKLLQVAPNTVLEAIRRGQLPAVMIGDRYRIPASSLYALARPHMAWALRS